MNDGSKAKSLMEKVEALNEYFLRRERRTNFATNVQISWRANHHSNYYTRNRERETSEST